MGSIRIDPTRTRAQNQRCRIFSVLWRFGQFKRTAAIGRTKPASKLVPSADQRDSHREQPQGASLSQSRFLNRQTLYLRPDPARVVVRPFKPATEPRDLNPTDKLRANHIVDRVLRLDAEAAARQLSEVLENFEGRHRNLLEIFETRAAEMEEAFEPHAAIEQDATLPDRRLFSSRVLVRGVGLVQSEHRPAPRPVRRAGKWLSIHPEPSRRRRRAYFIADVPVRHHSGGRKRRHRSDRASRVGPKNPQPDVRAPWATMSK